MMLLDLMVSYADLMQTEPQMAIAPAIIAALIGAGASIYGANKAGKNSADATARAEAELKSQRESNNAWYAMNRRNYMDTNEAQLAIANTQRSIDKAISDAREEAGEMVAQERGRQAVMGGIGTGLADARKNAREMISDAVTSGQDAMSQTMGDLASIAENRKMSNEQAYLQQSNNLSRQMFDYYGTRAAQSAAAGSGAMQNLGSIASSLISSMGN